MMGTKDVRGADHSHALGKYPNLEDRNLAVSKCVQFIHSGERAYVF
jgi:hypothetical protein